jgi:hypothetical protein
MIRADTAVAKSALDDYRCFMTLTPSQRAVLLTIHQEAERLLVEKGEESSGLFGYYRAKLESFQLAGFTDIKIVELVRSLKGQFARIWDIGTGIGILPCLLAAEGFDVMALECNARRHAALCSVLAAVTRTHPSAAGRVTPRLGMFPDAVSGDDVSGDLAVATECTFAKRDYEAFMAGLRRFGAIILDPIALHVPARERPAWRARIAAHCEQVGVPAPAPAFACFSVHDGSPREIFFIRQR